ncbi:MAG: hypothetical protein ACO38I_10685, partial [Ilumatobacteraceae bacterium]
MEDNDADLFAPRDLLRGGGLPMRTRRVFAYGSPRLLSAGKTQKIEKVKKSKKMKSKKKKLSKKLKK